MRPTFDGFPLENFANFTLHKAQGTKLSRKLLKLSEVFGSLIALKNQNRSSRHFKE